MSPTAESATLSIHFGGESIPEGNKMDKYTYIRRQAEEHIAPNWFTWVTSDYKVEPETRCFDSMIDGEN